MTTPSSLISPWQTANTASTGTARTPGQIEAFGNLIADSLRLLGTFSFARDGRERALCALLNVSG